MVGRPVRRFRRVSTLALLAAVAGALLALAPAPAAAAPSPTACENRTNTTYDMLLECVTLEGVRAHQAAFQAIADANGGTRAAGTAGTTRASTTWSTRSRQPVGAWTSISSTSPSCSRVQQLTPTAVTHAAGGVTGSALGTVTNAVTPIDINLIPPRANTSGCDGAFTEAAVGAPLASDPGGVNDFAGFVAGRIALIQRGGCSFALKVANAQTAGAAAVILFNQGDTPARSVTLTNITAVRRPVRPSRRSTVPLVGVSFAAGESLSQAGTTATGRGGERSAGQRDRRARRAHRRQRRHGRSSPRLRPGGPRDQRQRERFRRAAGGRQQIAKVKPENTLRFAWWGGEEAGLIGSTAYVNGLSQAERDRIALYLNFDMVGSPNYIQMVYDADQSSFPPPAGVPIPAGSAAIEDVFESYYTMIGEPYDDTQFCGRSDYQGFIVNGIPSGGLFTGAEGRRRQSSRRSGAEPRAQQFDPCYHLACDTFLNVNDHALDVNSDSPRSRRSRSPSRRRRSTACRAERCPGRPSPCPRRRARKGRSSRRSMKKSRRRQVPRCRRLSLNCPVVTASWTASNVKSLFAGRCWKPSVGLEPTTPSLPSSNEPGSEGKPGKPRARNPHKEGIGRRRVTRRGRACPRWCSLSVPFAGVCSGIDQLPARDVEARRRLRRRQASRSCARRSRPGNPQNARTYFFSQEKSGRGRQTLRRWLLSATTRNSLV